MFRYEIRLEFHVTRNIGLTAVEYQIFAESYESAFRAALSAKDHDFPNQQMKDIHVYCRE